MSTTHVFGLGNVLMGDDGWGPIVVDALESRYVVDASVQIVDLGTPGLDLLPWLTDAGRVVIVDTIRADAAAGSVRVFRKDDILRRAPGPRIGPHQPGLKEALLTLEFAGRGPDEVLLIGAVPDRVTPIPGLSPRLAAAISPALAMIAGQLRAWSVPVTENRRHARKGSDFLRKLSGTAIAPASL